MLFRLIAGLALVSHCFGGYIYILNNGDGTLSVLDEETLVPISGSPFLTVIPFSGQAGQDIATNTSGTRIFIANQNVDPMNFAVLDAPSFTPIPGSPFSTGGLSPIAVAAHENRVYVVNSGNGMPGTGSVTAFNATTLAIEVGPVSTGTIVPDSIVISPDGSRVYVASSDGNINIFDADLVPAMGSPFPSGVPNCHSITLNPAGTLIYVGTTDVMSDHYVAVLTANIPPIPILGSPFYAGGMNSGEIAVNDTYIYVANSNGTSNNLGVLDVLTYAQIPGSPFLTMGMLPSPLALNPSGTRLYVANIGSNDITIFDPATLNILGPLFMSGGPTPIAFAFGIGLLAPSNLQGQQKINDFGIEYEYFNLLTWNASTSTVAGYYVYRDGSKIATLESGSLQYEDHNRKKGVTTEYSVTSFDISGNESSPISISIQ